jgi:predicted dehydrogenase
MKRIGLMGCGVVAQYGHIPAIQAAEGLSLHAIFDPNEKNLRETQAKFGIPHAFTDAEAFFRCGLDGVSIASPAPCHHANVMQAAAHRLPVICEKPLATNRAEAEQMIEAMKTAGVSLYPGFCYRFSPCALKIRELVREGAIGEVRSLRLIYNWSCHGKFSTDAGGGKVIQKRREDRMLEGGPLLDCGTHQIDLAGFWLGSPVVSFNGRGAWVDDYEAPDHMWVHLHHASGAHTVVEISYSYFHTTKNRRAEFVYELIGTAGVIRYDREAESFTLDTEAGRQELPFGPEKNFEVMYEEWGRALASGSSELLTSAEEGLRVVEIAQQATDEAMAVRRTDSPR